MNKMTLDSVESREILNQIKEIPKVGDRLEWITRHFLGRPYFLNSLIGGPGKREVFTATYKGFDCVTLIETSLALAWARKSSEIPAIIKQIRYRNGEVSYNSRLHYTTDWSSYQVKRKWLKDITKGPETELRVKELSFMPEFKPHTVKFRYFPKKKLGKASKLCRNGDLIYFASTRKGLDTFHVGLLFQLDGTLYLRHASRSQGGVVQQTLKDFVKKNSMPGFMITRPMEDPVH